VYAVLPDDHYDRPVWLADAQESVGCRGRRCGTLTYGVDDLGVTDPVQFAAGDPKVCVLSRRCMTSEGTPSAGHLDGVRLAELMPGEPSSNAGRGGSPPSWAGNRG
jgi:hypothetical protein